ncbi:MarR family transcriptional regulator [Desulfosporosinus fructosivorans]|uniref:MarR family transcriptional regulator n=1 Tax=Desulfosporosinus fructosivorans TaxID=2018669 RepID=A0A4Z0R526_9FIRM|nr:FeoC-like transcriptional regulator [Desulfosporosinus fructosivorans]TGE36736.1 MarR family transcriptional regulator [Desulfosporosinus fructosivorans]
MLTSIMRILARKESLSMTQLAQEIGCTIGEIESALEQMVHMGYIHRERLGQSCSSSSCGADRCEGCGFVSSESFTVWELTERGLAIVGSELK